jgi:uncharacterized protein (TIGR02246 family)
MKVRAFTLLALPALLAGLAVQPSWAEDVKDPAVEKAALIKASEAFIEAFHKGDARAVAAFWAPDGDYIDQTGRHLKGREDIEKAFAVFFKENKGLKLRIDSDALRFVTGDVALEDGVTSVIPADGGPPSRARYTIVHVKKDGQWLLGSVRDTAYSPPTHYEHLRDIEWLIGSWADAGEKGAVVRIDYSWAKDQNFIVSTFTTTFKNIFIGGGTQWIGYDAANKQIRSWAFELNGGFGEGTWTGGEGKGWTIKTNATTHDGAKVTASTIIKPVDADTFTLQIKDLTVGGKPVPDSGEIKMKRQK